MSLEIKNLFRLLKNVEFNTYFEMIVRFCDDVIFNQLRTLVVISRQKFMS